MVTGKRRALPAALAPAAPRHDQLRRAFAERVTSGPTIVLPGAADGLGARLIQRAGFEACYATGAGIANVSYGVPDIGLITMTEMVDQVLRITDSVTIPVVVDADTGHGGPLSVMRTTHMLEAAGAAAIQIEDQATPKRCGHFETHRLIDSWEMQAKIDAAVTARSDESLLIIGRTDALGVMGIDEAIRRGHAYRAAGADVIFIEAPQSLDHLRRIGAEFAGIPLVANMVEGGRTPLLSAGELSGLGFTIILFANFLMRVMARAGLDSLTALRENGDSRGLADSMLAWSERQELVDLPLFSALDDDFDQWRLRAAEDRRDPA